MSDAHRLLLLALVLIAAVFPAAAQASTLVEHNAEPLGLPPSGGSPPEFGRCIKVPGGAYENGACTKASGSSGHYEWHPAFGGTAPLEKTGFTSAIKEATVSTLETVSGSPVICHGESSSGRYTGNNAVGEVVVTFTGCAAFEASCTSAGAATGTIVTSALEGVLGIEEPGIEPSADKIAEELRPTSGTQITSFSCAGVPVTVSGALIGQVLANAMKPSDTVKFRATDGKQQPEGFFGEPAAVLSARFEERAPEQAGESLTTIQTNEERVEINTVA